MGFFNKSSFNKSRPEYFPVLKKIVTVIRMVTFAMIVFSLQVSANVYSHQTKLSINVRNQSIKEVLFQIESQSDFRFIYVTEKMNLDKRVTLQMNDQTVVTILNRLFEKEDVSYEITENKLILISPSETSLKRDGTGVKSQQYRRVNGVVLEHTGEPVIGANVVEKGTANGVITDIDGKFSINIAEGAVLQISYIGYITQEVEVNGQYPVQIILSEDFQALEEVIVIGYGVQKKVNMTGSVSNIDFENSSIESRPLTNVSSALSGMSPGIVVRQTAGTPGSDGASIKIRGVGSLNSGQDPLVVIDGQPGDINAISPNDVSSISVLKDAASSAIYGSRASNGVILITTKSGSDTNGKVTFSYTGSIGFTEPTLLYDIVSNTADHMALINQIEKNSGLTSLSFTQERINEWREKSKTDPILYPNTDWWDVMIKSNAIHNHSLSARGGNEKISFYSSFNYMNNEGLMANTAYEQFTFRNNLTYQVNDWLKMGNTLTAMIGKADPASPDAVFQWFNATTPGLLPKHPDGRYGGSMTGGSESGANNQLAVLESARGESNTQRYTGKIFATITPIKNLDITGSYFLDMYNFNAWSSAAPYDRWDFQNEIQTYTHTGVINISNSYTKTRRSVYDVYGNYSFAINDNHFSVMAGFNQEYYKTESFSATKRDLYSLDTPTLDAASTNVSSGGSASDYGMRSFFGRINYEFAQRYLFEANLRIDGSSRFSPDERWGFFPSFSAGWRVSEEKWWGDLKNTMENLKIRLSWGQLGNNSIGNYDWQNVYSPANYNFNGTIVKGVAPTAIANDQITWETTDVLNMGLDMNLLKKWSVTLEYYNKYTKGILYQDPIPYVNGGLTAPMVNSAEVSNKGLEIDINYRTNIGKDFVISAGANGSFNKNKIEKYKGDLLEIHGQGVWTEGQPIGKFYVREIDHIIQDQAEVDKLIADGWTFSPATPGPGDFLYKDQNGDKNINDDDRVLKGNPVPVFTYGASLTMEYKGFDLYALLNGVAGWDKYVSSQFFSMNALTNGYLYPTYFLNSWTEENRSTKIPKIYVSDTRNSVTSEYYLHKADYMRIKTLQLGYTIPLTLTRKIKMDKIRAYVNLENFFTFTSYPGMDPETSGSSSNADTNYPLMKTISFGLNLNF